MKSTVMHFVSVDHWIYLLAFSSLRFRGMLKLSKLIPLHRLIILKFSFNNKLNIVRCEL